MTTQNIYEYKKIKPMEINEENYPKGMKNKINELVVEYNHLAKDFELYKKAFKLHSSCNLNEAHNEV